MSNARDLADLGKSAEAIDVDASAPADSVNIDASGNLLVGKTALGIGTEGIQIRPDRLEATRDGGQPLNLNRLTSNGTILNLAKDGTTVGSIASRSSALCINYSSRAGLSGSTGYDAIFPGDGSGNLANGTIDLGNAGTRFKDLFLSGGIYLGGITSANYLDDYEEGTWTPAFQSVGGTSLSVTSNSGMYTKIGRFVMVTFRMNVTSSGSGIGSGACVTGLPFTPFSGLSPATSYDFVGIGGSLANSNSFSSGDQFAYFIDGGDSKIHLSYTNAGSLLEIPTNTFSGDESMRLTAYYFTS